MGLITLTGPDGQVRARSFFGVDTGRSEGHGFADDGSITPLEIVDGRWRLEKVLNGLICGYGGPLGNGGWGGINEVCLQPWNMGGPAREQTPDGYTLKTKLQLTEEYNEKAFAIFHTRKKTPVKEVEVTIRWENGKVRLYQGNPPPYQPPPPPPAPPEWGPALKNAGDMIVAGIGNFFQDAPAYTASIVQGLSSFMDSALAYINSFSNDGQPELAENP